MVSKSVPKESEFRKHSRRGLAGVAPVWMLIGALSLSGCGGEKGKNNPLPSLLHAKAAGVAMTIAQTKWGHIPVPAEDGPTLLPVSLMTPVMNQPTAKSEPIGYLRLGERVARSAEPISKEGCAGGWYAVRPLGFVCHDERMTLKEDHPLVRAFPKGADRSKPLPYSYAFVRAVSPNYLRVPTKDEQLASEMRLERHLKSYAKLKDSWNAIAAGANQVPLGRNGAALGTEPSGDVPDLSRRFGGRGADAVPWWLQGGRKVPNISTFRAPPYAVMAGRIKRHAGVALVDSFVAGDDAGHRRFSVSVDGRLIPSDKLKPDSASAFHGAEFSENMKLPVAFPVRPGARAYQVDGVRVEKQEELPHRAMISLTGKARSIGGTRLVETTDGRYLRSEDLKVVMEPSQYPWFAKRDTRWIDISILNQTLVLYEGTRPVYATLISSGRDGLGEPGKTLSTPTGTFRIQQKHVTTTMDSQAADSEFELRDVPWVMYFHNGYALHAAYWHDDFGRPRSHGCVNLSPIDARYVFSWSTPDVPDHFHAAYAGDTMGQGTLVHIHE